MPDLFYKLFPLVRIFELLTSLQVKKCVFFPMKTLGDTYQDIKKYGSPLSTSKVKAHEGFKAECLESRPASVFVSIKTCRHNIVFQV